MSISQRPNSKILRLNVGFILAEQAGYSRDIEFEYAEEVVAQDVVLTGLHGKLRFSRTPQGVLVQGALNAQTPTHCTRCLAPFELEYAVEFSDLFVYPRSPDASDPYYVDESGFLDLSPIMREEGILAVPMQALCMPECKGLCSQCGQDWNMGPCDCDHERIDPRMASLRALLDE